MNQPRHIGRIWIATFGLAWATDLLFWNASPGISFPIWIGLALIGLFLCAFWEGQKPAWPSYLLAVVTLSLAATNAIRAEPFSRVYTALLALGCLTLLSATLLSGHWLFFRISDYILTSFKLIAAALLRAAASLSKPKEAADTAVKAPGRVREGLKRVLPYLRGTVLALPVLAILGSLLASADPIFSDRMRVLLAAFDLGKLPEYIFRLVYILTFGYIFCGLFLHAVLPTAAEERPDPNKPVPTRFLGSTESLVVFGGVIALFAFFLVLQFRYLFGGQANITETGYTYSDYARRGFFELVWVVILSLGLYSGLSTITRRETVIRQRLFSFFAVLLLVLVLVILLSALQRMLLYEAAYGYTRLRTYTHTFIPWLGILLGAAILLETLRRPGHFGLALLVFCTGFGLTLTALDIDGLIARLNLERARAGSELDFQNLSSLSSDAIPFLAKAYTNPAEAPAVRERSGAALACYTIRNSGNTPSSDWRAYNFSERSASQALAGLDLKQYLTENGERSEIKLNNTTQSCYSDTMID